MASVLVVGGGLAGLVAAWRLGQAGHDVEVLEAASEPGGRFRSENNSGFLADRVPCWISSADRHTQELIRAVGLAAQLHREDPAHHVVLRNGVLHAAPTTSLARGWLGGGLLSRSARLRLGRLALESYRERQHLDAEHLERAAPIDALDLDTALRRWAGDEATDFWLAPLFGSLLGCDPSETSAAVGLLQWQRLGQGAQWLHLAGGTGRLVQCLAQALRVRRRTRVVDIESHSDGVRVHYRSQAGTHSALADVAVLAIPAPRVADLCAKLSPVERGFFESVHYSDGTVVQLCFERAPSLPPFVSMRVPQPEGLGVREVRAEHRRRSVVPKGGGMLSAVLTRAVSRRLATASDTEVGRYVCDQLQRTPLGRLRPQQVVVHRSLWGPKFRPGYAKRLAAFLSRIERSPRLVFVGDYRVGPHPEGALVSGLRAVDEVDAQLRAG